MRMTWARPTMWLKSYPLVGSQSYGTWPLKDDFPIKNGDSNRWARAVFKTLFGYSGWLRMGFPIHGLWSFPILLSIIPQLIMNPEEIAATAHMRARYGMIWPDAFWPCEFMWHCTGPGVPMFEEFHPLMGIFQAKCSRCAWEVGGWRGISCNTYIRPKSCYLNFSMYILWRYWKDKTVQNGVEPFHLRTPKPWAQGPRILEQQKGKAKLRTWVVPQFVTERLGWTN